MTIEEFIAARLEEDEAIALAADRADVAGWNDWDALTSDTYAHTERHDPARAMRQAAGLRALITVHKTRIQQGWGHHDAEEMLAADLAPIAAVWCEHPDYQEAWKP